jgi:hypothetical protein
MLRHDNKQDTAGTERLTLSLSGTAHLQNVVAIFAFKHVLLSGEGVVFVDVKGTTLTANRHTASINPFESRLGCVKGEVNPRHLDNVQE